MFWLYGNIQFGLLVALLIYFILFSFEATPPELNDLITFWTGWENLPACLSLEIVQSKYPTAATCYETLRIPSHYKDYKSFKEDMLAYISSSQTGFGLLWVIDLFVEIGFV